MDSQSEDSIKALEEQIKELDKKIGGNQHNVYKCDSCSKTFGGKRKKEKLKNHKIHCFAEELDVAKVGRQCQVGPLSQFLSVFSLISQTLLGFFELNLCPS